MSDDKLFVSMFCIMCLFLLIGYAVWLTKSPWCLLGLVGIYPLAQ